MDFPDWTERERNKTRRAQKRLKFMLLIATVRKYGRASIRKLANDAGCDHSSIFNAINRGSMTEPMARSIEKVVGRGELHHEWLMTPLDAGQVTQ